MDTQLLTLHTGSRLTTDITTRAAEFCRGRSDGLLHVFVPHATAGVAIFETGAGSEEDLEMILESVLPRTAPYRHRHGSPGHGRDHVLPAFIAPSISIPVISGELQLGTWQSLIVVDPNVDNSQRQIRLSYLVG